MSGTTYSPSPRPTFDGPTRIVAGEIVRHVWGDDEAGQVADWIVASTGRIHCLIFGLPAGGAFLHSPEFRTVFGADELLHVLAGTMLLANPETGEVLRVPAGRSAWFRADTWHHAFAAEGEPLRVLELFAPPPSTGSSGAYARTRPYLERADWRYGDDALLGSWPAAGGPARRTLHPVRDEDLLWRIDGGAPVALALSTEHLTAGYLVLGPGGVGARHAHAGDELLYLLEGSLLVRAWHEGGTRVFELGPGDAAYLPLGCEHEVRNVGAATARAVFGVAPAYTPGAPA